MITNGGCRTKIKAFLQEHLDEMRAVSSPESKHSLDLDGLRQPAVTFWSVYDGDELVGCGALKKLDNTSAELKSMRTARTAKRRGVASALLQHVLAEARRRGFTRLYLETGADDHFAPAPALYTKYGFTRCEPFADYPEDPNSVHMTKVL
ncbi:GNAT family N-acetyltransferase [Micromonospora ureilytica]|uniref:GNAT family N-acetyltransferase n=1 Tax=Micromonospora ureilytica TaxID=709868 RepID=UPI002E14B820|nr:GNAT family N-acetyltransferase [Micromonospora ureilytica]